MHDSKLPDCTTSDAPFYSLPNLLSINEHHRPHSRHTTGRSGSGSGFGDGIRIGIEWLLWESSELRQNALVWNCRSWLMTSMPQSQSPRNQTATIISRVKTFHFTLPSFWYSYRKRARGVVYADTRPDDSGPWGRSKTRGAGGGPGKGRGSVKKYNKITCRLGRFTAPPSFTPGNQISTTSTKVRRTPHRRRGRGRGRESGSTFTEPNRNAPHRTGVANSMIIRGIHPSFG